GGRRNGERTPDRRPARRRRAARPAHRGRAAARGRRALRARHRTGDVPDVSESTGLRDVAALAGVSAKTVSNVMHGRHHKVSAAARARVEAAIAELDYRPNLPARRLREGRTRVVRVALPDPLMPYFAELTQHIVESAHARDHRVVIDPS